MVEWGNFNFQQNVSLENPVVKDHINEIKLVADKDALLSGFETKAISKLNDKIP